MTVPVGSTPHDGQLWCYDCRRQTLTLNLCDQHLVGWTEATGAFPMARNEINGTEGGATASSSEMTGPTSSPDRRTLFATVQEPGAESAPAALARARQL